MSPPSTDDLPTSIGLAAGGAVARLGAAADHDGRLVLAAIAAGRGLVGARRHGIAGIAGVRILPMRIAAVGLPLPRVASGAHCIEPVGAVHRTPDLVADQAAEERASGSRDQPPLA